MPSQSLNDKVSCKMSCQPRAFLRSFENPNHVIYLPHKETVSVGRNEKIRVIKDPYVSRDHLLCTADLVNKTMELKANGLCYSGANGYAILRGEVYQLRDGDMIEVRLGLHKYKVVFEPSQDEPESKRKKLENIVGNWETVDDLLIYTSEDCMPRAKIASFDLDGTLIKTKSGKVFPTNFEDWKLNMSCIIDKLRQLYGDDHKLVIFTNQSRLANNFANQRQFKTKVENIIQEIGLPMQVFVATGQSIYRKPALGMWNILKDAKNKDVIIDISKSFYVGDAAGRENKYTARKDHSSCDRLFALNAGLKFYTPEEYFLSHPPAPFVKPKFDPKEITHSDLPKLKTNEQEIILMVGSQGSGKTFYCKKHLIPKGYVHVNRDQLGTSKKCLQLLEDSIRQKQRVVIDNTNPDRKSREEYIKIAKKFGVNCRCFLMSTTFLHAKHNNRFRQLTNSSQPTITEAIRHSFKKKYEEPSVNEGFSEVVSVPFVPKFENEQEEALYKLFLLES